MAIAKGLLGTGQLLAGIVHHLFCCFYYYYLFFFLLVFFLTELFSSQPTSSALFNFLPHPTVGYLWKGVSHGFTFQRVISESATPLPQITSPCLILRYLTVIKRLCHVWFYNPEQCHKDSRALDTERLLHSLILLFAKTVIAEMMNWSWTAWFSLLDN